MFTGAKKEKRRAKVQEKHLQLLIRKPEKKTDRRITLKYAVKKIRKRKFNDMVVFFFSSTSFAYASLFFLY